MRIIRGDACVAEGAAWLASQDPRWAAALARTGPLPLRRTDDGFQRLLSAIVSQQVSTAAARSIWGKLETAGFVTEDAIATASDDDLRGAGLSRQKARYARGIAEARLDYGALRDMTTDQVVASLIPLPGIGRWTAEIYAMFALGHADAFCPGDLALQEGARMLFDLPARPTEKALRAMAEEWSPWRAVAARLLWAYYGAQKTPEV